MIVGVVVWVAVVLVASTMVWAVISRAGREVVVVSDPQAGGTGGAAGTVQVRPGNRLTHRPSSGHTRGGPSTSADPSSSTDPSDGPTTPPTHSTTSSSPKPGGGSSSSGGPVAVKDTWTGRPGSIALECTGSVRSGLVVVPADGYRWELDDRTSSAVKVKFERTSSEGEVEVWASCQSGVPRFQADGEDHEVEDD